MNELVEKIINIDNTNVIESMDDITLDNNICLEYMDYYGNTYYYNNKISSCLLGHNKIIDKELIKFKQSGEETSFEKILNPINNSVSLLYGIKKGNKKSIDLCNSSSYFIFNSYRYVFIQKNC